MSEIDINARFKELDYFVNITNNLAKKFDNLTKNYDFITSRKSQIVPSRSASEDTICAECLSKFKPNDDSPKSRKVAESVNEKLSEDTICAVCSSSKLIRNTDLDSSSETDPLRATTSKDTICAECWINYDVIATKVHTDQLGETTSKITCANCLSKQTHSDYSSIWLLPRSDKLKIYETAIKNGGNLTEPEMTISFSDGKSSNSFDDKKTLAEITKYKRDIKRKRMKYRTTKAPPLTHTEEIRSLIAVQMELWEQFCNETKKRVKKVL